MKSKWLLPLLCVLPLMGIHAQEKYTDLIAWLPDKAGVVCYSLAQSPSITLDGTAFVVNTAETTVTYEQSMVDYLTLGDGEQAITGVSKPSLNQSVKFDSEILYFKGCKAGAVVGVYDAAGRLLSHHQIDSQGNLRLSFGEGKKGIFVVKIDRWALKIIRR